MAVRICAVAAVVALTCSCAVPVLPEVSPIYPSEVLDLRGWTLTTPLFSYESGALEIAQPALSSYRSSSFRVSDNGKSVVFATPANGAVQVGAEFPRTELREADGSRSRIWSALSGRHSMTVEASIDVIPPTSGVEVIGQVHEVGPYILLIQLTRNLLYVKAGDENIGTLDADYRLGTRFTYTFLVEDGEIQVFFNGELKASYRTDCVECYFKVGSYLQAVPEGELSRYYGQTSVYQLDVRHEP